MLTELLNWVSFWIPGRRDRRNTNFVSTAGKCTGSEAINDEYN